MSLVERKSAFLSVLSANLDKNIQAEIMTFWEEKYSNKPQFGVSAFLDELYSKYDISIKKGQLFRELSRATTRAGFKSGGNATNSHSNTDDHSLVSEEGLQVYQSLQEYFLAMTKAPDKARITDIQVEGIRKTGLVPPNLMPAITAVLKNGSVSLPKGLTLGALKKMFNLGYVECCQLYGPVKTDQMLNNALQKTNMMAEAQIVPPVQFI